MSTKKTAIVLLVTGLAFVSPSDVAATPQCPPVHGEVIRLVRVGKRVDGREVRSDTNDWTFSVYADSDAAVVFHTDSPDRSSYWSQRFSLGERAKAPR